MSPILEIATSRVPFTLARLEGRLCEVPLSIFDVPPGIYFLIAGGCVVYVGKTVSLANRLLQHYAKQKRFDRVLFLPVADSERRTWIETELIRTLRPTLNGHDRLACDVPCYRQGLEELLAVEFGEATVTMVVSGGAEAVDA